MGNTNKNKSKRCRRKIRIRLADPNIPDSYVCEIFDSSLENEEENSRAIESSSEKNEDLTKPKNYFELLMSKKDRKNGAINSGTESEGIQFCNDEHSVKKRRQHNQKHKNPFYEMVISKKEESIYETDSSDDETLLQIQRNCALKNIDEKKDSQSIVHKEDEKRTEKGRDTNEDEFIIFDSPKVELSQKKKLNILSYFSKTGSRTSKISSQKLEEITCVVNSLKTCQTTNHLRQKELKKQESGKKCQNENKISLSGINKENVKLAPLFCKKVNKIIDSDRQKARLDFLYRGLPSAVKKTESKGTENVLNFPAVPHVQQRDENACWSPREICFPLPKVPESYESAIKSTKKFSLEIKDLKFVNNSVTSYSVKINKEFLSKAKCKYVELNLDSVIDGLKEKRDKFQARVQEIEKSKMAASQKDASDETGFEELNALWTEKYKPKSSEILGNGNVVKKLKKWLQSWKSFDEELKVLAKSNRSQKNKVESDEDSSDDFLNFGDESYGLKIPGNVCVISGPNGCGKTALVYALANELEFGVLELNASSKRTGKKVLSDLQEATQSHKVHRVNVFQTDRPQTETKKKKNKKRKKSKKVEKSVRSFDQTNNCKISLILIEDADIVFEDHDEGYFAAIATLVQTSKRPLIFLSNEPNCHHLYGFKTDQSLILEMELPSFYNSCAVLDVVSSLEGAAFDKELLQSLVRHNNFDLRKSLLQLQFWIHSGKNPTALQKRFDLGHLWWGLSEFLFNQDMKHSVKPKGRKRKRDNDLFDSSDEELEMATKKFKSNADNSEHITAATAAPVRKKSDSSLTFYFSVLDLASSLDAFCVPGSREPIPGFEFKPKDSLSLNENLEESSWARSRLGEQLSEELVTLSGRIFVGNLGSDNEDRKLNFVPPCWEEIRWRYSQEKASEELSVLVSPHRGRDKRSLHLDYLPALRNICRVERNRAESNPKRKNRFYHYLNGLGVELTDENLEINCEVFDR